MGVRGGWGDACFKGQVNDRWLVKSVNDNNSLDGCLDDLIDK